MAKSKGAAIGALVVLVIVAVVLFAFFWERPSESGPKFELSVVSFTCADQNATFEIKIWNNGTAPGDASVRYTVWNETGGTGILLVNDTKTYRVNESLGDPGPGPFNTTETFRLGIGPFGQGYCGPDIRWEARLV